MYFNEIISYNLMLGKVVLTTFSNWQLAVISFKRQSSVQDTKGQDG